MSEALRERRSGLKPCNFDDALLKTYIGRVEGLEDFSLENGLERFDCRNNRLAWLGLQQDGFMVAVAEAKQRYGADRIAVVMGTSTSGILETEHAYRNRDPQTGALPHWFTSRYRYTHNMFSLGHFVRSCFRDCADRPWSFPRPVHPALKSLPRLRGIFKPVYAMRRLSVGWIVCA